MIRNLIFPPSRLCIPNIWMFLLINDFLTQDYSGPGVTSGGVHRNHNKISFCSFWVSIWGFTGKIMGWGIGTTTNVKALWSSGDVLVVVHRNLFHEKLLMSLWDNPLSHICWYHTQVCIGWQSGSPEFLLYFQSQPLLYVMVQGGIICKFYGRPLNQNSSLVYSHTIQIEIYISIVLQILITWLMHRGISIKLNFPHLTRDMLLIYFLQSTSNLQKN